MRWFIDLLRCGSCRFTAYYALTFYVALADAGRLTTGWLIWGAAYWSLFSLGTELINRLSDRVEDATNRPERTALCNRIGYDRLKQINLLAWVSLMVMAVVTVALRPQVPLAVFLALGILASANYSLGIRLKRHRFLALFVLTFPYGGTFFTGWTAAYPPGSFPNWIDDLLFRVATNPAERKMAREFFYHLWMAFIAIELFFYVPEFGMRCVIMGMLAYWIVTTQWLHWHGGVWKRDLCTFSSMVRQAVSGGDSMNKFELIAALERKYRIRYGKDVEHLNSIAALVLATEQYVSARPTD